MLHRKMSIFLMLCSVLLPEISMAAPVALPDSARPGAVRPEQEDRNKLPQASPEVLPEDVAGQPAEPQRPGVVQPEAETPATDTGVAAEPGAQPERPGVVQPEAEQPPEQQVVEKQRPAPVDKVEVPAVIDRPFDVSECPCLIVKKFQITNAEDLSEYGVNPDDVNALLDQQVKDQPENGYSVGQFQEVADKVRNYYRQKGLILTQVVVPVQTVENGVVNLEVYVGKLGRVLVEGNSLYSKETLENAFSDLVDKPVVKSNIEAALLRLTDYPGLTVFGVFQPGQLVGTADIVLKVQNEKRFAASYRLDNHGTQETGMDRFRTVIDWNNPTGGADKLSFAIQQSYLPKNNDYNSINYERRLGDGSYTFSGFANRNSFDVGGIFRASQIHSDTENVGISLEKSFFRSRVFNLSADIGFTKKQSITTTAGTQTSIDDISVFNFKLNYDSVDTISPFKFLNKGDDQNIGGGINFATLEFSRGVPKFLGSMGTTEDNQRLKNPGDLPSRKYSDPSQTQSFPASGEFDKFFLTYTRLQTVRKNVSLLYRMEWQFSPDALVPLEQYSVGGPDSVRAFPVAQVLWDQAFFTSFEFLFNAPFIEDKPAFANRTWGEILQLGIFYDLAVGKVNDPTPADSNSYQPLAGAGFGARFNLPGMIESRLFWAWAINDTTISGNGAQPQFWGDFTYSF